MKSYSINEWCALHGFSRAYWYKLLARNEAPRCFHVGRVVRITEQANLEWLAEREVAE